MIMEIPQLIRCGISRKSEITVDHAASARGRGAGGTGGARGARAGRPGLRTALTATTRHFSLFAVAVTLPGMRYLVEVPNFGEFAAPGVFAEVARRAEEAGCAGSNRARRGSDRASPPPSWRGRGGVPVSAGPEIRSRMRPGCRNIYANVDFPQ